MTAGRSPGKDDRLYRSEAVPAEPANSTVVDYLGHPDKLRGQRGGASERQAPPPVVPTILCVPGSWRRDQRRASRNKRPTHGPALRSAVTKTSPSCSAFGAFRIAAAEKSSKAGSAAAGLRSRAGSSRRESRHGFAVLATPNAVEDARGVLEIAGTDRVSVDRRQPALHDRVAGR